MLSFFFCFCRGCCCCCFAICVKLITNFILKTLKFAAILFFSIKVHIGIICDFIFAFLLLFKFSSPSLINSINFSFRNHLFFVILMSQRDLMQRNFFFPIKIENIKRKKIKYLSFYDDLI
jgi:hypothetical protein